MTESVESSAPSGGSEELVQEQQQEQQEANGGQANGGHQQSPAAGGGQAMAIEVEAVDVPAATPIEVVVVNGGGGTEKKAVVAEAKAEPEARRTSSVAVSRKQTKSVALTDPPAEKTRPPCYLERANLWSILTFGWMTPVIKEGNKRILTEIDMPELPKVDTADHLRNLAQKHWDEERALHPYNPKLWRALFKAFFPMQVPMFLPFLVVTTAKIVQAHVGIKGLIEALDNNRPAREGYIYAGVIVLCGAVQLMLHHQVQFMGWRLGLAMRTSLEAAVFRKVLRMPLSLLSQGDQATGAGAAVNALPEVLTPGEEKEKEKETAKQTAERERLQKAQDKKEAEEAYKRKITASTVINLATTDVERFQPVGVHSHYLFLSPFEIVAITWCGVTETGLPFMVGMLVLLCLIPIQARVAKLLQRASRDASQLTDERVRLTKQAIHGARTIKMSGWETLMDARIRRARALEVAVLIKAGLVRGVHEGIYFLSPVLVGAATFVADSLLGRELDAGRVFSTLTLFNILQWDVVNFAGKAMQSVSEMWVSIGRLERLLLMPELPDDRLEPSPEARQAMAEAARAAPAQVKVERLTFSWDGERNVGLPTLRNVSLQAVPGRILGLAGPVGSGKTTLLLAILGELAQEESKKEQQPAAVVVTPPGPIAYAAQEPWILTGSVRDNIVMRRPFDPVRYKQVLKAACLATDLAEWEHGDHTVIGDRGVNVSGGQKARIGLARMAYGEAALYLIDDALSALDPKVGRSVFQRLICGMLRGKTRVLATHQLQYLLDEEEVPCVAFINRGKLRAQGTLLNLTARGYFKDMHLPSSTPSQSQHVGNGETGQEAVPRPPVLAGGSSTATSATTSSIERAREDLAKVEEQCRERNMAAAMPGTEPVLIDLQRQETLERPGGEDDTGEEEEENPGGDGGDGSESNNPPDGSRGGPRRRSSLLSLALEAQQQGRQQQRQRAKSSPSLLRIGVLQLPVPSIAALTSRSSRHLSRGRRRNSSVSLALPFIDDGHDGGVALATECEPIDDGSPASKAFEDEFNFSHDNLPEEERRRRESFLLQREAVQKAREQAPDSDEEIDGALERGDTDAEAEQEEREREREAAQQAAAQRDSIVATEGHTGGGLGKGTYKAYLDGMGGPVVGVAVLLLIMSAQAAAIISNLFLSHWVHLPFEQEQKRRNIYIYVALVGVVAFLAISRAMVAYHRMLKASQHLHDNMVHSVLRAPVSFFDTNPTGRIINRTTKDVLICDSVLPVMVYAFLQTIFMCIGTVFVVVSVNPWLLFVLIPLLAAFVPFRRQFLNTSREARRLEAVARSPVYALFSEALDGLATIRSLLVGHTFQAEFSRRLDAFSRPYFIFFAAGRHLGFRLDLLCWLMMAATAFSSLAAKDHASGVSEWLLGMSLMYVLQLAAIFQWATRQSSDVENQIVSVERITEYCRLQPEAALDSAPGHGPRPTWPEKGAIEARNLQVAYRPGMPLVLKGLSFRIEGGQRVGICGRTGSGKSTLIQALFRLMEPAGGSLLIDGVDTATLGLHDLRQRIAVIPQNPFLFSGTLRENLDPMGQHDDAALWASLRAVQMEEQVRMMGVDMRGCLSPSNAAAQSNGGNKAGGAEPSEAGIAMAAAAAEAVTPKAGWGMGRRRSFGSDMRLSGQSFMLGAGGPGLDLQVTENGGNFSLGERQLLCLARAILQNARILVCDEATANVDIETDAKIQRAIRERFASATVLMIAHRLNTIIDSDLILMLDAGRVLEAGHPHMLLNEGQGLASGGFASLVAETGPETEASLKQMAKEYWRKSTHGGQAPLSVSSP